MVKDNRAHALLREALASRAARSSIKEQPSAQNKKQQAQTFTTPDGDTLRLRKGEEVVWIAESGQKKRVPYIRRGEAFLTIQQYRDDQKGPIAEANYDRFSEIDETFAELYWIAATEAPQLAELHLKIEQTYDPKTLEITGGFFSQPTGNGKHLDATVTIDPIEKFTFLIKKRPDRVTRIARSLGMPLNKLKEDVEILKQHALLHEIGHIVDFIRNYVEFQRNFEQAYSAYRQARVQQLNRLPLPGCTPIMVREMYHFGELEPIFERRRKFYKQLRIRTPEELLAVQEIEFSRLPAESHADGFAAHILGIWRKRNK
jgi:hypothetical protein